LNQKILMALRAIAQLIGDKDAMRIMPFSELSQSNLVVDAIYESSHDGQLRGEPISKLLPGVGNMGGFRISGKGDNKKLIGLFTTGEDKDWPDSLDLNTGQFIYYGDNKTPGHDLHDTPKDGNKILRYVFELLHSDKDCRLKIPPFFLFKKHPTNKGARSVQFKGIAVPGFSGMAATEDLVAVWKTTSGQRFQNYRSVFTVLDIPVVNRAWVNDILAGNHASNNAPKNWQKWVKIGHYEALKSEPTTIIRTEDQQLPETKLKTQILESVWQYFDHAIPAEKKKRAFLFEKFAARLFEMSDDRVKVDEITRGTADGGRDAIGKYRLGLKDDPVFAEFALEAKCYQPAINGLNANRVGVKEVARLISRIRHRQFGVLVTTSVVHKQAYQEVRDDRHPIIFIAGIDIAEILISKGLNTPRSVQEFLNKEFPS